MNWRMKFPIIFIFWKSFWLPHIAHFLFMSKKEMSEVWTFQDLKWDYWSVVTPLLHAFKNLHVSDKIAMRIYHQRKVSNSLLNRALIPRLMSSKDHFMRATPWSVEKKETMKEQGSKTFQNFGIKNGPQIVKTGTKFLFCLLACLAPKINLFICVRGH